MTRLSERKTVDGIWFLILIIYVYTADTCLNLLACVQVYEPINFQGKRVSKEVELHILVLLHIKLEQVYYFDGTLQCFAGQHLPYGVIAILVSVLVLIPLPTYVLAVSFNYIKVGSVSIVFCVQHSLYCTLFELADQDKSTL